MANSNVSDEMLRALGRVTVNFQLMEMMINTLTGLLISEDARIGQIITSNFSFSRVCDVFLSIVRLRADGHDELITEVEGLIKTASELEHKRNTLVHSCYTVGEGDGGSHRFKYTADRKKGWKFQSERLTPLQVHQIANEMGQLYHSLVKFMIKTATTPQEPPADQPI